MQRQILQAREERWNKKRQLAVEYSSPVIALTLNIPGPEKTADRYLKAHALLVGVLQKELESSKVAIRYQEIRMGDDGPEAFWVVAGEALELKKIAIRAEENHPLGRLADIDVMSDGGEVISRSDLGVAARKCFVCDKPAHLCAARGSHSLAEVLAEMEKFFEYLKDR